MLERVLKKGDLEEVSEGIYSCLPATERASDYDKKVGFYDAVIGNRFYNRLIWGNWPANYHAFCEEALSLPPNDTVLDAGCGSLVFTAKAYAESSNTLIVLLDRSLGMLERGRKRLITLAGSVPKHIVFIQGDILRLPFHNAAFDTVVSQGLLHMFDEKASLLAELERVKKHRGKLYFTSLVGDNALGRKYLAMLQRSGEVATIHSSVSLGSELEEMPFSYDVTSIGNMVYAKNA